ncbi:MAG: hypothetical protein AAB393_14245, partial [Bacteroidota bacterium]
NVVSLTAGSDGTGQLQLGTSTAHFLNGNGDVTPDKLTLKVPGNARIYGTVGGSDPLEGLTITGIGYPAVVDSVNPKQINITDGAGSSTILISATNGVNVAGVVINAASTTDTGFDRTINLTSVVPGAVGTVYTITIDGNDFKYTSVAGDTLTSITSKLAQVIDTINNPDNVTFDGEVTINGDLNITATGTVTFKEALTLNNGGNLNILGPAQVVFEKGVVLSGINAGNYGNILVEGDEISFKGGGESVVGHGTMTLRPSKVGLNIELGTPPQSVTASTLNIDNNEIQAFADGFSKIVIGHASGAHASAGAGAVRVGAINNLSQPTLRDNVEIYGGSITVEDYSTPDFTLLINGNILLDAVNNININNRVEASDLGTLKNIVLYSDLGAI